MNIEPSAPIKEKMATAKKKKKATAVAAPKKQQSSKKKTTTKDLKAESKDSSNSKLKTFADQDISYSEMKNSYGYINSVTNWQEKQSYSGNNYVKSSLPASQHLSDEDYSDDEEEGEDGYKPGGYHPVCIGDRLNCFRYTVIEKLGWGHFSTVWLCHDKQARNTKHEFIALKVQKSAQHYREAAIDEIELLNTISNAAKAKLSPHGEEFNFNVVRLLDHFDHVGPNGKHVCMAFEILGENLLSVIKRLGIVCLNEWKQRMINFLIH